MWLKLPLRKAITVPLIKAHCQQNFGPFAIPLNEQSHSGQDTANRPSNMALWQMICLPSFSSDSTSAETHRRRELLRFWFKGDPCWYAWFYDSETEQTTRFDFRIAFVWLSERRLGIHFRCAKFDFDDRLGSSFSLLKEVTSGPLASPEAQCRPSST